jgi:hypothetical protein
MQRLAIWNEKISPHQYEGYRKFYKNFINRFHDQGGRLVVWLEEHPELLYPQFLQVLLFFSFSFLSNLLIIARSCLTLLTKRVKINALIKRITSIHKFTHFVSKSEYTLFFGIL